MLLLDTNMVSALRRIEKAAPTFQSWSQAQSNSDFYVSAVTILELELGALLIARRDAAQGAMLRDWIGSMVLPSFAGKILPVDTEIARRCARLHVPDPRSDRDAYIAATALVHGFTVVTRNVRDFEPMGVRTINPWTAAS